MSLQIFGVASFDTSAMLRPPWVLLQVSRTLFLGHLQVFDVASFDMIAMLRLPWVPGCVEWCFRWAGWVGGWVGRRSRMFGAAYKLACACQAK